MQPLGPFGAARRVCVAVSGGADSTALALLLSRWGRPFAAIVDHGLRPESAAEAAQTAGRMAAIGIEARVLRAGLAPGPAAAERARVARYDLLLHACREAGCVDLLLAHHAGDQAETVAMREIAGSGVLGLAGMAAVDHRDDARLLRPLLAVDPARLRATLRNAGVAWVEDPTNSDPRTLRARLRATLTVSDRSYRLALGYDAGLSRTALEREVATDLACVRFAPEGYAIVPGPLGPAALSALIWTISGRRYPPPRSALAAGLAPRTVHGVLLRPAGRLGPGTLVAREPAAVALPARLRPGMLWDGRFRWTGQGGDGLLVGALGADAARLRRLVALPACVLASLPALRRAGELAGELAAVPHLAFPDAETCRSVDWMFWPARPAAPAGFVPAALNPLVGQGV